MSPSDRPKPKAGPLPDVPDPDDPPSEAELRAAEALRLALEKKPGPSGVGEASAASELARSIRAVVSLEPLLAERHQEILDRALGAAPQKAAQENVVAMRPRKGRARYLAFGATASLLAMAAAIALVIRGAAPERPLASALGVGGARRALALSRSTAELFPEGIPRSGGTTDRVDRIAYARAQDFRQNQFARWGAP